MQGAQSEDLDSLLEVVASAPPVSLRRTFEGTERFELVDLLGEGSFGSVYEARDRLHDERVALKVLRRSEPGWLHRLKREFRTLVGVGHPNLVRLYELHRSGLHWFITMELVEGTDLLTYLRRHPERIRPVFGQVARGLCALHEAGLVHRDLKPANVRVTPEERVVLLDFGLSVPKSHDVSTVAAGTPVYMPPEQFGSGSLSDVADTYALGAMLYEVLAGAMPFDGTWQEVARAKSRHSDPPPCSDEHRDLSALCSELLHPQPTARRSASDLLETFGLTSERVERQPRLGLLEGPLVGRSQELFAMEEAFEQAREEPVVALVDGDSGAGKTTLCEYLQKRLQSQHDVLCLRSPCYEAETTPHKALDEAVDELARHLRRAQAFEVGRVVPRNVGPLLRLFPTLGRVELLAGEAERAPAIADERTARQQGFAALGELLGRLTERRRVVVLLDDLQWLDPDSLDLIDALLAPPQPAPVLWLMVMRRGASRASATAKALLRLLREERAHRLTHVPVEPLGEADVRAILVRDLESPHVEDADVATVVAESGGNPYFVKLLARRWRELGTARPPSLVDIWQPWADAFSASTRRTLELVCVFARPLPETLLARVMRGGVSEALAALRAAGLVQRVGQNALAPGHDRVRRAIMRGLSDQAVRAHHEALAAALLEMPDADPELLAEELAAAGRMQEAAREALRAAQRAEEQLAFERAARLYEIAGEVAEPMTERRRSLWMRRAVALRNAGRTAAAGRSYLQAAENAAGAARERLRIEGARYLLLSGDLEHGLSIVEEPLRDHGCPLPDSLHDAFVDTAARIGTLQARGLVRTGGAFDGASPRQLARLDLCLTMGWSLTHIDLRVLPLTVQALLDALDVGEPARLQRACALFALDTLAHDPGGLARKALQLCRELADELDDPYAYALVHLCEGEEAHFEGRFGDAEVAYEHAERLLTKKCEAANRELAHVRAARIVIEYSHVGDYQTLLSRGLSWLVEAEAMEDRFQANWLRAAHALAWLAMDDPDRARAELARARADWKGGDGGVFETATTLWSLAVDRYAGNDVDWQTPHDARPEYRSPIGGSGLLRGHFHLHRAWGALRAWSLGDETDLARGIVMDDVQALRDLEHPVWQGVAEALEANRNVLSGQVEQAIEGLQNAERRLRGLGMLAFATCVRRRRGELVGGDLGARVVEEADAKMKRLGIVRPEAYGAAYFSPFPPPARGG